MHNIVQYSQTATHVMYKYDDVALIYLLCSINRYEKSS